jgi:aldehyde dehydrogenase (NAD+)
MTTVNVDRTPPSVSLRIGDQRRTSGSGGEYSHVSSVTGSVDATVPLAGAAEVDAAVVIAHEAFSAWSRTRPADRRRVLLRLADLIDENAEEFGRIGTLDNGIPTSGIMASISAEWTRYYAGWCDKLSSDVVGRMGDAGSFSYTLGQPYGVIGAIITWNAPLLSLAMKVPAIMAGGNTVVVKPSELTPFTGQLYMDLVAEAGFPSGVINMLPGTASAGEALVRHQLVKKVSFTGGPATAQRILQGCSESMKPVVLELGGKSANIVFADADLDTALPQSTALSCAVMAGQSCNFGTRMLVERSIYEDVVNRVKTIAESFRFGDPFEEGVIAGPVISEASLNRILQMIERAKAEGARLITGGCRLGGDLAKGFFIGPTVLADVDPASELAQNEVFGPVLAIIPFETEQQAIEIANSTPYGLSGYIQTTDLTRALRVAEELDTGEVLINGSPNLMVNRPYGGFALSGVGKEGGRQGVEEFLKVKGIGIAG